MAIWDCVPDGLQVPIQYPPSDKHQVGTNIQRERNLQGKHTWKITPREISGKE